MTDSPHNNPEMSPPDIPAEPLRGGSSANFRDACVEIDPIVDQARIKPTLRARLFGSVFLILGAGLFTVLLWQSLTGDERDMGMLFGALIALVFIAVGLLGAVYGFGIGATFNRQLGLFTRRRYVFLRDSYPLEQVRALQICSYFRHSSGKNSSSYTTYELNAILDNSEHPRINLMCHAAGNAVRDDAQKLADFLNVPLHE